MKTKLTLIIAAAMAVLLVVSVTLSLTACNKREAIDLASTAAMLTANGESAQAAETQAESGRPDESRLGSAPICGTDGLPFGGNINSILSNAASQNSTAGASSSSKPPTGSSTAPPASSSKPASSTPTASKPNDYSWIITYAKQYGASIGMVWSDHGSKETSSWGAPVTFDDSISDSLIKTAIENNLKAVKQIQISHGNSVIYYKVLIEPYEYDNSLTAIYFLY